MSDRSPDDDGSAGEPGRRNATGPDGTASPDGRAPDRRDAPAERRDRSGGGEPPPGDVSRRRPATAQERDRPPGERSRWSRRPRRHRRGPEEGPEKRSPERLGGFLERLLEKWGIADDVERAAAVADWDEIVGEETARRTRPVGIREGTVFVEVESASWMQELNMMRHEILRRINAGREKGRVEKIVFLQAGRSEGSGSSSDRKGRS